MEEWRHVKSKIGIFVLLVFIIWFGYYATSHAEEFKQLTIIHPEYLALVLLLIILQYGIIGLITKYLMEPLSLNLKFGEAFGLSVTAGFYNLVSPFRAGMAIRAVYLKNKYQFSYTNFVTTLSVNYIFIFWIGSVLALMSIAWIFFTEHFFNIYIFLFFTLFFLSLSYIFIFRRTFRETKYAWVNKFIQVVNNWSKIKSNHRILFLVALLSLAQLINTSVMLYMQFRIFDFDITMTKSILLAVIGYLGTFIGITPASLGIKEALITFSATTIGITTLESLSVVVLGRILTIVVLFTLGSYYSYYFTKKILNQ